MSATKRIYERLNDERSRAHRYLTDAYTRGADHQRDGEMSEAYELRIAQAESWAREFIGLRPDWLASPPGGDEPSEKERRDAAAKQLASRGYAPSEPAPVDGDETVSIIDAATDWIARKVGDPGSRELMGLLLEQIESDRERIRRLAARTSGPSTGEAVEKDNEGRPYQCGAFVACDGRWECVLESDHEGEHEWRIREPVGTRPESEPDAMCHATHWRRHLDEWDRELTIRAFDPEKCKVGSGPPWPVWIGTPPTRPESGTDSGVVEALKDAREIAAGYAEAPCFNVLLGEVDDDNPCTCPTCAIRLILARLTDTKGD